MDKYLNHPSVDAGSDTHVHPWNVTRYRLGQELDSDGDLFKRITVVLEEEIGPQKCASIKDAQTYFDYLETHYAKGDMLDYLIYLMEHVITLYIDLGTLNMVDLLKGYKVDLEKLQRKLERDGMLKDTKFVGREQYMTNIRNTLTDISNIKGLCICGLGGLGKTSLAKEACLSLGNTWTIHKVNLREKSNIKNLIRSTLDSYFQPSHGDSVTELEQQLFNFLQTRTNRKEILLFDNMDDIIKYGTETMEFINMLLHTFYQMGSACKAHFQVCFFQMHLNTHFYHNHEEVATYSEKILQIIGQKREEYVPSTIDDLVHAFKIWKTLNTTRGPSLRNELFSFCSKLLKLSQ